MSRGWITAAILFFLLSCCLGGRVMTRLEGREGLGGKAESRTAGTKDAG